jgi:sugar phosphate isomerase/epimerase
VTIDWKKERDMKINASITDFPFYTSLETFFKEFKAAGVDGIELVIGAKTWHLQHALALSKKYQLPIASLHQSIWSGLGFGMDEWFLKNVREHEIHIIVLHPLVFTTFTSDRMKRYFDRVSRLQKKYDITFCLENMPKEKIYQQLYTPPYQTKVAHLQKIYDIATHYNFGVTYDISHALFTKPQEEMSFKNIFPKIKNIHLSSFQGQIEHLPLDTGDFAAKEFLRFLKAQNYKGLLTFEINYSLFKRMVAKYDFFEVQRSVKIVKDIIDK